MNHEDLWIMIYMGEEFFQISSLIFRVCTNLALHYEILHEQNNPNLIYADKNDVLWYK